MDTVSDASEAARREPGRRRLLAAALAMAAAVGVLAVLVALDPADPPLLGPVDRWWREVALGAPGWAEAASRGLKFLGSGWVMVPLRLVIAAWLLLRRRYAALGAWLLAWAVADAVTWTLKPSIGRLRPDGADATSFPSGHAKTAAQVALGIALLVAGSSAGRASRWVRTIAWATAIAWVVAMAASRTVLDEHWLTDVVAGGLLGAACAIGAVAVVDAAIRRRGGARSRGS